MRIFLFAFMLIVSSCLAQNESNYWCFGTRTGLFFDKDSVKLTAHAMRVIEGTASISDGCGLLFYTNGDSVWNKNHVIMKNGFGLGGLCTKYANQNSSTQSSIIVRQPQSDSIYFIFTTDCIEDSLSGGLRYSIVNMNRNNGIGEVQIKNQLLFNFTEEKVTAAKHSNNCDIWIISHESGSNNFVSFLLTAAGLSKTPVISSVGQSHGCTKSLAGRGCIKVSPNFEMLVSVNTESEICDTITPEVFSFNRTNGKLQSLYVFPADTFFAPKNLPSPTPFYGASFSPDNSKLYLTGGFSVPYLIQYDLSSKNAGIIYQSKKLINAGRWLTHLTIAIDGRIYSTSAFYSKVSIINKPNESGINCNFIEDAIDLTPGFTSYGGLPNFYEDQVIVKNLQSKFTYKTNIDTLSFTNSSTAANSYYWNFGDGNFSSQMNPIHIYKKFGQYKVKLTVKDANCNLDKFCKTISISNLSTINLSDKSKIKIFPNPVAKSLHIEGVDANSVLKIYDVMNNLVMQFQLTTGKEIIVEKLKPGYYFYEIKNIAHGSFYGNFIKL